MSFPGKVIENRWFVSLSCLRVQILVRVPNFSRIYLWKKKIERCEQGSNLRGKFPLDFKSNALTTRPSQLFWHYRYFDGIYFRPWTNFCLHFCSNFCWGLSWWSFPNGVAYMSFPGRVIENLWLVSISCLRTQVLVRVPNFFWLYFWKMRSKAAIGARTCAGSSHWVASPTLWPLSYRSSFDINVFLVESDCVLGQFFACANLRFFGWRLSCWSFPNAVAYISFPGKVIENLWFVSLSCLRTQVLVHVRTFLWIYFWKWDRRLRAGLDRARDVPIGFQVQRLNHWSVIALLTLILFWWNPILSSDNLLLALIFDFFAEACRGGRFQTLSSTCPFQEK